MANDNVVPLGGPVEPEVGDVQRAIIASLSNEVAQFTLAEGAAPESVVVVLLGNVAKRPMRFRLATWTRPHDDAPPLLTIESVAAALIHAGIARATFKGVDDV